MQYSHLDRVGLLLMIVAPFQFGQKDSQRKVERAL